MNPFQIIEVICKRISRTLSDLNCAKAIDSRFLIFLILFIIPCLLYSQNNYLRTKYFTLEDGLSQVSCNSLSVDNYGFIWIATENGLNRFDGKSFKHFKYSEFDSLTISGNYINKLLVDKTERIWIGTVGNGLNYYNEEQEVFHRITLNFSKTKNETITDLAEDENENIWVAAQNSGLHKLQPLNNGSFKQTNFFQDQPLSALFHDKHNMLWIGSFWGEIYRMNLNDEKLSKTTIHQNIGGQVRALFHTDNSLLIGCESGLYFYDLKTKRTDLIALDKDENLQVKHVTSFLKSDNSTVWVGTGNGLYLFDWMQRKVIRQINYSENNNEGLSNNTVLSLLKLDHNQILVGTSNNLNMLDFTEPYFKNISKNQRGKHLLNDNVVFSIFKDGSDLWIGTSDGGLNLIRNKKTYYFKEDQNNPNSISGTVVRAIVKDEKNKRLWVATTRGLNKIDLNSFNPEKPEFTVYNNNPINSNSISGDFIKDIALDQNNNLWGATFGQGVFRLAISEQDEYEILRYKNEKTTQNSLISDFTQCIEIDKENNIWVGTQGGLTKLEFINNDSRKPVITNYYQSLNSKKSLSHNSIYDILVDKKDNVWLGTRNGLNLFSGNNKFESWANNKLLSTVVYSIQDDEFGNLWLGTSDGILNFNTKDNSIKKYGIEDGIQSKEFDIHAKFRDSQGSIYLGGIAGLTYFQPHDLDSIDNPKPLYFSQLRIKDQIVKPKNTGNGLLSQTISKTNKISFKHNQFPFYLQFSTIDFRLNKDVEYAYKLLPSDTIWNPIKNKEIQFLNLPSKNYTLQVTGFSRGKEWTQPPLEMKIEVLPPFWARWWAYIIYLIIAIAIADRFYRFQLSKRLAVAESKRLQEVGQLKNALFTNITHEFRTPLTVIKGMTGTIKSNLENRQDDDLDNSLEIINRNSDSLLNLINEMLDLAKIESGNMELKLIQADIIPFTKYLTQSFHSLAEEKNVNFSVDSEIEQLEMDLDVNKFKAIVTNLLSNAIKFTPENGKVHVSLDRIKDKETDYFVLKVNDSGLGISKDDQLHIFDKFYQVDNTSSRNQKGTGIGLALVKEFVELMKGTIGVESISGEGSMFIIKIPVTNKAIKSDDIDLDASSSFSKSEAFPIGSIDNQSLNEVDKNLPLVLIVEDNFDVAHYIKTCLEGKYQMLHAPNGTIGIEMALNNIPDIIISDVMMPEKDGFEVCENLKTDELTDHIPIIMLTAKATFEDRLTGLSHGADAYLTKPFEKTELLTRINQLILLRKKMLAKFEKTGIDNLLSKNIKNSETKFLNKIITVINENMTNHDFGPIQLALQLRFSESQLYRKLKATSGKSTAVFIRSIKLQKGKELIQTTNKSISEVAYDVGFNDPSYFSRAFKEEFGHSPSTLSK